jgi:hypothetical protein
MLATFDRAAEQSADIVRSYQLVLSGLYQSALGGPAPTAPRVRYDTGVAAQQAQVSFLGSFAPKLQQVSEDVLGSAVSESFPGLTDASREQLQRSITDARNELLGILVTSILKDAETINKGLRDFALRVDMHMNARRVSYAQAIYDVRKDEQGLMFSQLDRGGKKWSTSNYVRTSVRGFLVKTYVESYLYGLAHRGEDAAKVVYPDQPGHLHDQAVFSITGKSDVLPSYDSLKADVWHPNTRALVSQV